MGSQNRRGICLLIIAASISFILVKLYLNNKIPVSAYTSRCPSGGCPKNILFAFVSVGSDTARSDTILRNLAIFENPHAYSAKYRVDCVLYSYCKYAEQPNWLKEIDNDKNHMCKVIRLYNQSYVSVLKSMVPSYLKKASYDYITITLDDVALVPPHGIFNLEAYFDIIEELKLTVATPAINNTWHKHLQPLEVPLTPNQVGRTINMIEIQSATYSMNAWECMHEIIDTEFPSGVSLLL